MCTALKHYSAVKWEFRCLQSLVTNVIVCSTDLFNRSLRPISETSKISISSLCEGNPSVVARFPSQRACNEENVSRPWSHHAEWLLHDGCLNSLRPSDAYMRQWSNHHWFRKWLVAWSAPSHYQNQCWNIVQKTPRNKLQWNFNRNSNTFIQENAFESVVCEKAAILSRPQCAKDTMEI